MRLRQAEVVIIGGGVMGLSTAYHLAHRGYREIIILEQADIIGGQTTMRCMGGIRHQFSTAINIQLSCLSMQILSKTMSAMRQSLDFQKCGYSFALTNNDDLAVFQAATNLQRQLGVATELWSGDVIRTRLPLFNLADVVMATFYNHDGFIDPYEVVRLYLCGVRSLGVTLLQNTPVTEIGVAAGCVCSVMTPWGQIDSPIIINAAGPWAASIAQLAGINLPIKPVRHHVLVTSPVPDLPCDVPVLIFPSDGLAMRREGRGLMLGVTKWYDEVDAQPHPSDLAAQVLARATARLPALQDSQIVQQWSGLYEMTPDLHPIIGESPMLKGFYCIGGFSGHGFMHAPAAGLLLSEVIVDGYAHTLNISPLSFERLSQAELPAEHHAI